MPPALRAPLYWRAAPQVAMIATIRGAGSGPGSAMAMFPVSLSATLLTSFPRILSLTHSAPATLTHELLKQHFWEQLLTWNNFPQVFSWLMLSTPSRIDSNAIFSERFSPIIQFLKIKLFALNEVSLFTTSQIGDSCWF